MVAMTVARIQCRLLWPSGRMVLRAVAAGAAWGLAFVAGLTAMKAWQYGGICLPEAPATCALSVAVGVFTIGPLAACGLRSAGHTLT
jgi:hypothetical protein